MRDSGADARVAIVTGGATGVGAANNPYHTFSFPADAVNNAGNVQTVAGQLFTNYLLPFEITSMLLLVAAIGAVYLTDKHLVPVDQTEANYSVAGSRGSVELQYPDGRLSRVNLLLR